MFVSVSAILSWLAPETRQTHIHVEKWSRMTTLFTQKSHAINYSFTYYVRCTYSVIYSFCSFASLFLNSCTTLSQAALSLQHWSAIHRTKGSAWRQWGNLWNWAANINVMHRYVVIAAPRTKEGIEPHLGNCFFFFSLSSNLAIELHIFIGVVFITPHYLWANGNEDDFND